jgi:hypothetical protein
MQHSLPIADFPAERGWLSDSDQESTTANRLMMVMIKLPGLRQDAKKFFSSPTASKQSDKWFYLMSTAAGLDAKLKLWFDSLPKPWQHRTVATLEGSLDDPENAEVWPGPMYVYEELVVSNIVNNYRMARIFSRAVMIGCLARQATSKTELEENQNYQECVAEARSLVDGVCASVPYHLGYDVKDRTNSKDQNDAGNVPISCATAMLQLILIHSCRSYWRLFSALAAFRLFAPSVYSA